MTPEEYKEAVTKIPLADHILKEIRDKINYPVYQLYSFYVKYKLIKDIYDNDPIPKRVYKGWNPRYNIYVFCNINGTESKLKKFPGTDIGLKEAILYVNLKVEEHIRVEMRMAKELGIEYTPIFNIKDSI